ncbi:hypothetical protein C2S52_020807 [Perilla frutescens var. hirtella]|nr:hypothetical protein C2S52_020807 [Perilla frutescens var. hirtella]
MQVVDNFDARQSEINIQDGRRLHIEAADVHRVLGLSNGGRPIVMKRKFEQCKILDAWLGIFGRQKITIVAKDVAKEMLKHINGGETAMGKRNKFIKNLPDGPSFILGLTQEGDAGLENKNKYFDFSLTDDDAKEVQFVKSGRRSKGVVINDNGNADGTICDKQSLEKDQMKRSSWISLYQEKVIKQNEKEKLLRDVEHFDGFTNEMNKEKEVLGFANDKGLK